MIMTVNNDSKHYHNNSKQLLISQFHYHSTVNLGMSYTCGSAKVVPQTTVILVEQHKSVMHAQVDTEAVLMRKSGKNLPSQCMLGNPICRVFLSRNLKCLLLKRCLLKLSEGKNFGL